MSAEIGVGVFYSKFPYCETNKKNSEIKIFSMEKYFFYNIIFLSLSQQNMKKNKQINQFNSQGNQEGYWEFYYSNGQLHSKGHYVNGKKEGYWEWYYDNGQLMWKGHYVDGKQEGYCERYYSNGQLKFKGHYVRGEEIRGIQYEKE